MRDIFWYEPNDSIVFQDGNSAMKISRDLSIGSITKENDILTMEWPA